MINRVKPSAWLFLTVFAVFSAWAAKAPVAPVVVADLLKALIATGVNVLYSSDLVPPTLVAPDSLPRGTRMQRLVAALTANGLTLKSTGERTYVVTRADVLPAAKTAAVVPAAAPPQRLTARVMLDELSVYASRYEFTTEADGEPVQVTERQIESTPGAASDTVRALRSLPGLATNLSARPYIRGAMVDDVLVEYDGVVLTDPYHFRNFQSVLSVFDPAAVSRAAVFTGGFPVSYGTRSGGVIDLEPASLQSGSEYGVGANLISYNLETVGHDDRLPLDWLMVARASTGDQALQRTLTESGRPRFSDLVGRARWTFDPSLALTFGVLLLKDQLTFTSEVPEEQADSHSRDETAWLRLDWRPSAALHTDTSISIGHTERYNNGTIALPAIADGNLAAERSFSTDRLRSDWIYAPDSFITWSFGGEFNREAADLSFSRSETFASAVAAAFDRPIDASILSNQAPHASTLGLYAAARPRWRAFEAELGLRLDAQDYQDFGIRRQAAPRLNIRYDLSDRWHAYASWGQFTQAQRVDEYRTEANQTTPDPANRAMHSIGGIAHETGDSGSWRLEAYRHHWSTISPYYDNTLGPLASTPQLEPDRVLVSPADADATGLELSAQRAFGPSWSAWGSYSLSRVTDDTNGSEVLRSWDQTHSLNLGTAWTSAGTSAALLTTWHTGWPRTSMTAAQANAMSPVYPLVGPRNSMRWGNFFSADIRLSHSFNVAPGELSFWLDGTNIDNRSNYCCIDLDSLSVSQVPERLVWLPRVINVGFTFKVRRP